MSENISPRILVALRDCKTFRPGTYYWKRKSMEKAVALGLATEVPSMKDGYQSAFILTDEGARALRNEGAV